jgi:DNA-binding transcriptional ArsR family regulator
MPLDDADTGQPAGAARPRRPELPRVRELTDARTIRALTHPVRIALIEALSLGGALTATEVGERIGETPTTCSFHLRQLAKYGFVEEAGGGKGRSRPWRMTSIGMRMATAHDDPETELAAGALVRLLRERQMDRYRTWLETSASFPRKWRDAAGSSESLIYLTADELEDLNEELLAVLLPRFRDRMTDPSLRPPGAVPVEFLLFSYPVGVPPAGPADPPGSAGRASRASRGQDDSDDS